jgi:hypothetical protein
MQDIRDKQTTSHDYFKFPTQPSGVFLMIDSGLNPLLLIADGAGLLQCVENRSLGEVLDTT